MRGKKMSKILIESSLKSNNEIHYFKGKGIKNNNKIIYQDEKVQTKIVIDNIITIERKSDYKLILNLKEGIKLKGKYINNYGTFIVETIMTKFIKKENEYEITYKLMVDEKEIDTFTYKLKFSLDT